MAHEHATVAHIRDASIMDCYKNFGSLFKITTQAKCDGAAGVERKDLLQGVQLGKQVKPV